MRKEASDFLIKKIEELTPGTKNADLYRNILEKMTDEEFADYIQRLENGIEHLFIIDPSYSSNKLNTEIALKVGESVGISFMEQLIIEDKEQGVTYKTPNEYLCIKIPVRRMSQLLDAKLSTTKGTKTDNLTGQVVGESKASAISLVQMMAFSSTGMSDSLVELMQLRGGDKGAAQAMDAMLLKYGACSARAALNFSTGTESTKTIHSFMLAMHLSSNLYVE